MAILSMPRATIIEMALTPPFDQDGGVKATCNQKEAC
jgi:hypothetical protein